jgi:hypothetical protein
MKNYKTFIFSVTLSVYILRPIKRTATGGVYSYEPSHNLVKLLSLKLCFKLELKKLYDQHLKKIQGSIKTYPQSVNLFFEIGSTAECSHNYKH